MYKDYLSKGGKWYSFTGLNLYKREELATRFNKFKRYRKISQQVVEDEELEYNLSKILDLYSLTLEEFDISEIDSLIINYIIPINFSTIDNIASSGSGSNMVEENRQEVLAKLISSIWSICDNAGDALYMIDKMPAETLLDVIKNRSEDLERMYMSKEDRQKLDQKKIKDELMNKRNILPSTIPKKTK